MSDKNAMWAIFDLDGCLFDDSHRRHYLQDISTKSQTRWDNYHAHIHLDESISHAVRLLGNCVYRDMRIIVITGRPERYAAITRAGMEAVFGIIEETHKCRPKSWTLAMRPDGDERSSPEFKKSVLDDYGLHEGNVDVAFDDRADVLDMYYYMGLPARMLSTEQDGSQLWKGKDRKAPEADTKKGSPVINANVASLEPVADLMDQHAATFRERYESYGNNAEVVGRIMAAMFPNGVALKTAKDFEMWHLFELMIVKLSRFSSSGLRHEDSINDLPAYCGMVHRLINDHDITFL